MGRADHPCGWSARLFCVPGAVGPVSGRPPAAFRPLPGRPGPAAPVAAGPGTAGRCPVPRPGPRPLPYGSVAGPRPLPGRSVGGPWPDTRVWLIGHSALSVRTGMVIAVIGYGPDHGFCNAGVARSDERDEARTGGGPLTNPAARAILEARVRHRLVDRRMHNRRLRREVTPRESWARTSPGHCSTRRAFAPRRQPGGVSDSVSESELDSSVAIGYTVPLRCLLAAP